VAEYNILVIGAGAIGAYYGSELANAGANVSVCIRSDYSVVKENGFKINSKGREYLFKPSQVINNPKDFMGTVDVVIVATKVLPEIDVINMLRPVVKDKTAIVLMQNGIKIETPVIKEFPDNEVISALCFICSSKVEPGVIHHMDYGHLTIGSHMNSITEDIKMLSKLFNSVGVECNVTDNITQARWKKLVWNAPFNPLSVIAGKVNTNKMVSSPTLLDLVRKVMLEVYVMAIADNTPFDVEFIDENINATMNMKPYKPSMLLDYENKRPMEVEAILGNAIRFANEKKLLVPYIESLYAMLKSLDEENRG
jgi:2-dehydropantoate 2-reductase